MSIENTSPAASGATLTEAELWTAFLDMPIHYGNGTKVSSSTCTARELLDRDHDATIIEFSIEDLDCNLPDHLEMVESDLRGTLVDLEMAQSAFEKLKAANVIEGSVGANARYKAPSEGASTTIVTSHTANNLTLELEAFLRGLAGLQGDPFKGAALKLAKALGPNEATMATALAVANRDLDEAVRQITGSAKPIDRTTTG